MLVQADRVFVTSGPLSELVWSPRKGLDLKCTDSRQSKNQSCVWWNTESFDVIISAPDSVTVGVSRSDEDLAEAACSSIQLVPSSNSKNNMEETTPGNTVPAGIWEQNPRPGFASSLENMETVTEILTLDVDRHEDVRIENTQASLPSSENCQGNEINPDTVRKIVDIKDLHVQISSSSRKPEECRSDLKQVNFGFVEEKSGCLFENPVDIFNKDDQNTDLIGGSSAGNSLDSIAMISRLIDSKDAEMSMDTKEDTINTRIGSKLTYFDPFRKHSNMIFSDLNAVHGHQCFSGNMVKLGGDDNIVSTSKLLQDPIHGIQNAVFSDFAATKSSKGKAYCTLKREKGKEKNDITNKNLSILEKRRDCHVSIESSSGKDFSTGKRPQPFDLRSTAADKRPRKLKNENPFSELFDGQESSFMKWVSGVANCFSSCPPPEVTMALVSQPLYNKRASSTALLCLTNNDCISQESRGFQSFVQALYHPRLKSDQLKTVIFDHQKVCVDSKDLQVAYEPSEYCGHAVVGKKTVNLQQSIPLSNVMLDQAHSGQAAPIVANNNFSGQIMPGELHFITTANQACNQFPSTSVLRETTIHSGGKETARSELCASNKSSKSLTSMNGNDFLGSFWITRLCPKAVPLARYGQFNLPANSPAERAVFSSTRYLSYPQNEADKCLDIDLRSSTGNHNGTGGNQELANGPLRSCSSKEMTTDQKHNSKLNPILPSHRFKRLQPMASVFAKRLDAFKHIKTSRIENILIPTSTCFFCGQNGHTMKECLESKSFGFDSIQNVPNTCNVVRNPSCLCIHCFHLNHGAIACPHTSAQSDETNDGYGACTSLVISEHNKGRHFSFLNDYDPKPGISCEKNFNYCLLHDPTSDIYRVSDSKLIKEQNFGERKLKGKQIVSCLRNFESTENQVIPVHNFLGINISNGRTRILEGIKELRLSRIDLNRGLKSSNPKINLAGFFLRVRLGKGDEGHGEAGYQVACICELSNEKSLGSLKNHISVDIAGMKCLLDCSVISNHGFLEDELDAWWAATSKVGGIPTEEGLTKKLKERKLLNLLISKGNQ